MALAIMRLSSIRFWGEGPDRGFCGTLGCDASGGLGGLCSSLLRRLSDENGPSHLGGMPTGRHSYASGGQEGFALLHLPPEGQAPLWTPAGYEGDRLS